LEHRIGFGAREHPAVAGHFGDADDRAQHEIALRQPGLDIRHPVGMQRLEQRLRGLGSELRRVALGERRLPEAGNAFLVAMVRRLALLGAHALGEVARSRDHHRSVPRLQQPARHLDGEGASVLAPVRADRGEAGAGRGRELAIVVEQLLARTVQAHRFGLHPQQLVAGVAEDAARRLIEVEVGGSARVDQEHHVAGCVERRPEAA
jgi:hypothetical protein